MCDLFGTKKAAKKQAAEAAKAEAETKAREDKRQADIKAGNAAVDSAFSQYDNNYYDNFKSTYTGNFNPEIDKQYSDATGKMTAALAGRGMLDSSLGAAKFGEALTTKNAARARVANDAEVAAGDMKGKVAARKTDLYSLNQPPSPGASLRGQRAPRPRSPPRRSTANSARSLRMFWLRSQTMSAPATTPPARRSATACRPLARSSTDV